MSSLPVEGNVFYFGTDTEFSGEMKTFFSERSKAIVCREGSYVEGSLIKLCSTRNTDIVFIDFSEPGVEIKKVLMEAIFLKRIGQFTSVLLVALFKNEFQKEENNLIFSSGFQLSFIKGAESDALFRDSFFIGLRKRIDFPILALARNINLNIEIGICSTITQMDKAEFRIETDIEDLKEKLKTDLKMFPELKCPGYEIKEAHPPSFMYPMTTSYTIAYPFSGPWTDDSEENIQPETVETWLDHSSDEFSSYVKTNVRIYTSDISIVNELYHNEDETVQFNCGNDTKKLDVEIIETKPDLIFFNLDDENTEDVKVSLKMLEFLLSVSMGHDYKPIIIVSNCISTGQALQKAYNYPMIVATGNKLTADLCLTLTKKYQAKKMENAEFPVQYFKPVSEYRSVDVLVDFMITSLTEHEVTFFSDHELPMFTVLHFRLPIEFHATLVPSIMALEKKNDKQHYMAFIHGLTEEQLMVLRKFVNQIIYRPMKDFSEESVKKTMGEALEKDQTSITPQPAQVEVKKVTPAKPIESKKYTFTGKSKL